MTHQFLGDYEALFEGDIEQPIPSWKALEWILEDVGQSRHVNTDPSQPHDKNLSTNLSRMEPRATIERHK